MNPEESSYRCKSPVAFLVFNRPETTRRVFAEIAKARPRKLLVVADGPRRDRPGEQELCEAVRKLIEDVDWDCELLLNYADENMGCARRVSSGLDWVFANVEEAIFLEDDCLPHPSFFRFCDEMLELFRDNEKIMSITGDNFQFGSRRGDYSYYCSRYVHVWGWASWRRAWKFYDLNMAAWPMMKEGGWLNGILENKREARYWTDVFDLTFSGKTRTWDYQWVFACWRQSGFTVTPNVNLISNIGFGEGATHTRDEGARVAGMATEEMIFPMVNPPFVVRDSLADNNAARLLLFRTSLLSPVKRLARQFFG
jgi:hypothetical protein